MRRRVGPERDRQRRAEIGILRADLERQRVLRRVGDACDLQAVVVEHDLLGVGLAVDVEPRRPADALARRNRP